jgi:hypothetical protein
MKEVYEEILKRHGIFCEDPEDILNAVYDMIICRMDKLKNDEPYAVNTIRDLEKAAEEIFNMTTEL